MMKNNTKPKRTPSMSERIIAALKGGKKISTSKLSEILYSEGEDRRLHGQNVSSLVMSLVRRRKVVRVEENGVMLNKLATISLFIFLSFPSMAQMRITDTLEYGPIRCVEAVYANHSEQNDSIIGFAITQSVTLAYRNIDCGSYDPIGTVHIQDTLGAINKLFDDRRQCYDVLAEQQEKNALLYSEYKKIYAEYLDYRKRYLAIKEKYNSLLKALGR